MALKYRHVEIKSPVFQADEAENKQFCYHKLTKIERQRVEASGATSDNEWHNQ